MFSAYGTEKGCLTEFAPGTLLAVPLDAIWLDLVEPTAEEEKDVEAALGIDIPTRGELEEIEASSRLYQEDGAAFMTANLIRRGEDDRPESSPVTFIIKGNTLDHHPISSPAGFPGLYQAGDEAAGHRHDRLGHSDQPAGSRGGPRRRPSGARRRHC